VPAIIRAVHDGDTATVDADLGWTISYRVHVRIAHINAPELTTPEGLVAKTAALELLPLGSTVTLTSHSLDKYGRTLGSLTLQDGSDFAVAMMAGGFAVPYEGGPR
jgi:endonuclease YncB( thermonuclease family)